MLLVKRNRVCDTRSVFECVYFNFRIRKLLYFLNKLGLPGTPRFTRPFMTTIFELWGCRSPHKIYKTTWRIPLYSCTHAMSDVRQLIHIYCLLGMYHELQTITSPHDIAFIAFLSTAYASIHRCTAFISYPLATTTSTGSLGCENIKSK